MGEGEVLQKETRRKKKETAGGDRAYCIILTHKEYRKAGEALPFQVGCCHESVLLLKYLAEKRSQAARRRSTGSAAGATTGPTVPGLAV